MKTSKGSRRPRLSSPPVRSFRDRKVTPLSAHDAKRVHHIFQVEQVAGYLIGYQDVRAIMKILEIPDKGVDDIMLKHPINDWLAKAKRYNIVCTTVGDPHNGFREEGILLVTHIGVVRPPQGTEPPVERDRDRRVKKWLVKEASVKEESLRWMSFPDTDEFLLLADGKRPHKNHFSGPFNAYRFTPDQVSRMWRSGKSQDAWVAEATANGEVLDRIWPPV